MSDPVVLLSTGDVVGPAGGVTDNSMVLFSGTSGKLIKGNNAVVTAAGLALLDDVNAAAQRATLGLGTAATATLATSTTDGTAGRVIKVGDFGLGGVNAQISSTDLNALDKTGFYMGSALTNSPSGVGWYYVIHQEHGAAGYSSQIAIELGASVEKIYARKKTGGSWTGWREIALTDSPAFTGTPTVPTAAATTNTTQAASTAFVQSQKTTSATDTTSGRVWRTDDLVKTTTPTDTTAGRVMKFGDFGLGAALSLSGQDLNDTDLGTGMYYCMSPTNGPGANGHLWQHRRSSTVIAQYYVTANNTNPKAYFRSMNGTWSVWKELWHSGNQIDLGTTATAAKAVLGLEDVTNTSDANKPVSTAQQTALNLKANLASPTFTGTPLAPTAASGTNTTQVATTAFVQSVVNGYLSKTVTGGTVVLTADELANSAMFFSGALTSNVIIQIANTSNRMYSVSNGTTGAFTLSVRSGTTGTTIPVAQGKRNLVFVSSSSAYDAITDFESIALTGVSTCPTALAGTNTTQIASTAYTVAEIGNRAPTKTGGGASGLWDISVTGSSASAKTLTSLTATITELNYVDGVTSAIQTQLDTKAPLASPALTGLPTAPTAAAGTGTTQLATTAFVNAEIANDAPTKTGGGASGSWAISVTGSSNSCTGNAASASTALTLTGLTPTVTELNFVNGVTSAIQTQLNTKAPLASPALTGTPTAPTANAGTNTAQLANTAFVKAAVDAAPMLGVGQTWQVVTGSRSKGTTYTNSTGKPIQLHITGDLSATTVVIAGVALTGHDYNGGSYVHNIVPAGATYSVSWDGPTMNQWAELR